LETVPDNSAPFLFLQDFGAEIDDVAEISPVGAHALDRKHSKETL
jgi:hypothetical protein